MEMSHVLRASCCYQRHHERIRYLHQRYISDHPKPLFYFEVYMLPTPDILKTPPNDRLRFPSVVRCKTCLKKGDHLTSECRYKERVNNFSGGTSNSGAYIHPGKRDGAKRIGSEMMSPQRNEENSLRVHNLPDDMRDPGLLKLFRRFGNVSRVCVAVNQKTGESRGFGVAIFVNKKDVEMAISKLNGYEYHNNGDNDILLVGWGSYVFVREYKFSYKTRI
ncbi:hypothetical protein MKW94_025987 [Papaver nudicaule]|uniref:RRM domain-containing protein n=1 Tax=Papaver nudicaule TaxID=74823 RepID=A0AA42AZH8_PAPNU|nr:hypothetical protein [Papaver nudicaule]